MSLKSELAKVEHELDIAYGTRASDEQIAKLERRADEIADQITQLEEMKKKLDAQRALDQRYTKLQMRIRGHHGSFADWLQWAESLYKIHDDFTVESLAVEWKEEKKWATDSKIEALEKIEQLLMYKEYDHFHRKK